MRRETLEHNSKLWDGNPIIEADWIMIPMEDAVRIVLDHTRLIGTTSVKLSDAPGLTLAEDVVSDLNMPPFDKAAMDGFAVIGAEVTGASAENPVVMDIIEEIPAGSLPTRVVGPGQASRIMTGAPMPEGADTVVIVEETETVGEAVRVLAPYEPGENRIPLGEDVRDGQTVLKAGTTIRPPEIGVLAAVGVANPHVYRRPVVGVVATGDEIVDPSIRPAPGQIRNSNGYSMEAQVRLAGGEPVALGIARDDADSLREVIESALERCDVLLLSGGVSAGVYDLIPGVMQDLGIDIKFDRIRMKPGKPLTFGIRGDKLVFGLPGNPVSTIVGLELLVRPAMQKMQARTELHLPRVRAALDGDFRQTPGRQQFVPARSREADGNWHTEWVGHHGSADLFSLWQANSLFIVDADLAEVRKGTQVEVILFDGWR